MRAELYVMVQGDKIFPAGRQARASFKAQVDLASDNVAVVLDAAGGAFDDIVIVTTFTRNRPGSGRSSMPSA